MAEPRLIQCIGGPCDGQWADWDGLSRYIERLYTKPEPVRKWGDPIDPNITIFRETYVVYCKGDDTYVALHPSVEPKE